MGAAPTDRSQAGRLRATLAAAAITTLASATLIASAQAAPKLIDSNKAAARTASVRVVRPTGVLAGDVVVAAVTARARAATPITAPAGWRQVRRDSCVGPGNAVLTQAIYVRVATSSEPFTTVWRVGSATGVAAGVRRLSRRRRRPPRAVERRCCQPQLRLHSDSLRTPWRRHARRGLLRPERGRRHLDAARDDPPLSRLDAVGIRARRRRRPRSGRHDRLARRTAVQPVLVQHRAGRRAQVGIRLGLRARLPTHSSVASPDADAADAAGPTPPTPPGPTPPTPPGARDITAPSAPGNVRSTSVTRNSVVVAWNASTDNVRVTGYSSYRNGTLIGTTAGTTTTFPGLTCATSYTFGVEAYDAAGNRSARSTVSASTSSCSRRRLLRPRLRRLRRPRRLRRLRRRPGPAVAPWRAPQAAFRERR